MANEYLSPGLTQESAEPTAFSWDDAYQRYSYFALVGFAALLVYSFWNMLETTSVYWDRPQYSHGWIMPLVALYLMWSRRPNPAAQEPPEGVAEQSFLGVLPATQLRNAAVAVGAAVAGAGYFLEMPMLLGAGLAVGCVGLLAYVLLGQPFSVVGDAERWTGLAIVLAGYAARVLVAAPYEVEPINRLSFIICLFGLFVMIGGWRLVGWAGPAIAFLLFMFPIPSRIEQPLLGFLQRLASVAGEVVLTILGQPVIRSGSRLDIDGVPLEVAEACSGMRMLTIFGGLALAMVFLINRPWWDRFIILLSAVPIALFVNVVRIVVTALLFRVWPEGEVIHQLVHDYAGLAMMPLAMGLLYLELKLLSILTVPEESVDLQTASAGSFAVR